MKYTVVCLLICALEEHQCFAVSKYTKSVYFNIKQPQANFHLEKYDTCVRACVQRWLCTWLCAHFLYMPTFSKTIEEYTSTHKNRMRAHWVRNKHYVCMYVFIHTRYVHSHIRNGRRAYGASTKTTCRSCHAAVTAAPRSTWWTTAPSPMARITIGPSCGSLCVCVYM